MLICSSFTRTFSCLVWASEGKCPESHQWSVNETAVCAAAFHITMVILKCLDHISNWFQLVYRIEYASGVVHVKSALLCICMLTVAGKIALLCQSLYLSHALSLLLSVRWVLKEIPRQKRSLLWAHADAIYNSLFSIREIAQSYQDMEQELAHAVNASSKSMDKVYAKSKSTEVLHSLGIFFLSLFHSSWSPFLIDQK